MSEVEEQQRMQEGMSLKPLVLAGLLLIVVATVLLLYTASAVYQLFNNPQDVPIVDLLLKNIKVTDQAVFGTIDGKSFDVHVSDPVRAFSFFFAGVVAFGVLAQVCTAIIYAGTALVKLGGGIGLKDIKPSRLRG